MKKKASVISIIVCAAAVAFFAVPGIISARPSESVTEKRKLASLPSLTAKSLFDGSYLKGVVTWYADTFPLRESMISASTSAQSHYGVGEEKIITNNASEKDDEIPSADTVDAAGTMEISDSEESNPSEKKDTAAESSSDKEGKTAESESSSADSSSTSSENSSSSEDAAEAVDGSVKGTPEKVGSIYIADGSGFSVYHFNRESVDSYASMVNTVAEKLGDAVSVYAIPAPDNFGVMLPEKTQKSLSKYEGDAFKYLYRRFSDRVNVVETFKTLTEHNDEYVYFRTDHHWTALGAYYAYRQFCGKKGFTPHEIGDYEEQVSEGFLGSFYSFSKQAPELKKNPDTIHAYKPISTNRMKMTGHDGKTVDYMVIQPGNSYSVFIGSDEPWEEIDNPDISDGSSCVLIKDSYGNAFAPFLVDHYDKVYVIDFRYYTGDLTQMIADEGIDDVIFMNNIEFLTKSNSEKILGLFHFADHQ